MLSHMPYTRVDKISDSREYYKFCHIHRHTVQVHEHESTYRYKETKRYTETKKDRGQQPPKGAPYHRFYKSLELYWHDEQHSSEYIPSVGVLLLVLESAV